MPGFDGTGPRGEGPMTGGGRGYCVVPVSVAGRQSGKGFFTEEARVRGWRNCFYATGLPGWMRAQKGMQAFGGFGRAVSKKDDVEILKSQADFLKQQLDDTQARIKDLEGKQEA